MTLRHAIAIGLALGVTIVAGETSQRKSPASGTERLRVQVLKTYPHDRSAFTQGLLLHGGRLYESTGNIGQSSLREVELDTGRVIRSTSVPPPYFAEGLTLVGDRLIQLTWKHGLAFVYDRATFTKQRELSYQGEGWGLCTARDQIVMSNGSSTLTLRRPTDFGVIRTVPVTMDRQALSQLNELECVDGAVYANVWTRDAIVRIDPATGRVTQHIDASNLLSPLERQGVDVLNGIAYDASDRTFLITGKYWPKLFRVRFVK